RAHYLYGRALLDVDEPGRAQNEFQAAIDLDPMPWRPPSKSIQAIRNAVAQHGGVLCDVQQAFRAASPGQCIGWELMDDHVHPSLMGQALMARAIATSLTMIEGPLNVPPSAFASLA